MTGVDYDDRTARDLGLGDGDCDRRCNWNRDSASASLADQRSARRFAGHGLATAGAKHKQQSEGAGHAKPDASYRPLFVELWNHAPKSSC